MSKIPCAFAPAAGLIDMHIVLVEPEIPPNTGNVARLCAATRTTLHLIEPFGFKLDDAQLKRAGMDYWQARSSGIAGRTGARLSAQKCRRTPNFGSSNRQGPKLYTEAEFSPDDYLVFGRETAGLPKALLEQNRERWLRIPMFNDEITFAEPVELRGAGVVRGPAAAGFQRRDLRLVRTAGSPTLPAGRSLGAAAGASFAKVLGFLGSSAPIGSHLD